MANGYSVGDLLDFLGHAADRGLLPTATAQALAVASRNVFSVLDDAEKADVRKVDVDGTITRFNNKRAGDFSPSSLKEYGQRVRRAVEHFVRWRDNPANFTVKTRATKAADRRERAAKDPRQKAAAADAGAGSHTLSTGTGGYQTSIPVRPGVVVTIANVPKDLTKSEAERLAGFIRMLAVE